ncbi:hypothetical protein C8R47DRAFT_1189759 [Mycena vitilis]|nr:hypothetical protein C8R47DRAFT_1189759 [Mycena vitilis]
MLKAEVGRLEELRGQDRVPSGGCPEVPEDGHGPGSGARRPEDEGRRRRRNARGKEVGPMNEEGATGSRPEVPESGGLGRAGGSERSAEWGQWTAEPCGPDDGLRRWRGARADHPYYAKAIVSGTSLYGSRPHPRDRRYGGSGEPSLSGTSLYGSRPHPGDRRTGPISGVPGGGGGFLGTDRVASTSIRRASAEPEDRSNQRGGADSRRSGVDSRRSRAKRGSLPFRMRSGQKCPALGLRSGAFRMRPEGRTPTPGPFGSAPADSGASSELREMRLGAQGWGTGSRNTPRRVSGGSAGFPVTSGSPETARSLGGAADLGAADLGGGRLRSGRFRSSAHNDRRAEEQTGRAGVPRRRKPIKGISHHVVIQRSHTTAGTSYGMLYPRRRNVGAVYWVCREDSRSGGTPPSKVSERFPGASAEPRDRSGRRSGGRRPAEPSALSWLCRVRDVRIRERSEVRLRDVNIRELVLGTYGVRALTSARRHPVGTEHPESSLETWKRGDPLLKARGVRNLRTSGSGVRAEPDGGPQRGPVRDEHRSRARSEELRVRVRKSASGASGVGASAAGASGLGASGPEHGSLGGCFRGAGLSRRSSGRRGVEGGEGGTATGHTRSTQRHEPEPEPLGKDWAGKGEVEVRGGTDSAGGRGGSRVRYWVSSNGRDGMLKAEVGRLEELRGQDRVPSGGCPEVPEVRIRCPGPRTGRTRARIRGEEAGGRGTEKAEERPREGGRPDEREEGATGSRPEVPESGGLGRAGGSERSAEWGQWTAEPCGPDDGLRRFRRAEPFNTRRVLHPSDVVTVEFGIPTDAETHQQTKSKKILLIPPLSEWSKADPGPRSKCKEITGLLIPHPKHKKDVFEIPPHGSIPSRTGDPAFI